MVTPDQIQPETLRPIKRSEYDQLVRLGAFDDERVELLRGAIVATSPQYAEHMYVIQRLLKRLSSALADRAEVRAQAPLALANHSEPEPDISVVPPGDYPHEHPTTAWLVVEAADSSLRKDRKLKGPLYAEAGIAEYWIVNLAERVVEVHSGPGPNGYANCDVVAPGGRLTFQRFPDVTIAVDDILP